MSLTPTACAFEFHMKISERTKSFIKYRKIKYKVDYSYYKEDTTVFNDIQVQNNITFNIYSFTF